MAPDTNDSKKKRSPKQLAALIGAAALAALYLITLLTALFSPAGSGRLFQACLAATVAIPLLIWIYIWMYGKLTGRHTITDTPGEQTGSAAAKDISPRKDSGSDS